MIEGASQGFKTEKYSEQLRKNFDNFVILLRFPPSLAEAFFFCGNGSCYSMIYDTLLSQQLTVMLRS